MNYKKSLRVVKRYHYNWWKIIMMVLLFPIVLFLSFLCSKIFIGYLFKYKRVGKNRKGIELNSYEELLNEIKIKKIENFNIDKSMIKEVNIGPSSKQISALIIEHKDFKSNKWIVGLHGFKRNKYVALRNVFYFYEKGYNIITFDSYAHGNTYGTKSDFGKSNAEVLNSLVEWLKSVKQVDEIGVFGVSMGATTSLYFAKEHYLENEVNWLIADCGFSGAVPQIRYFLKKYVKLPWWLMSLGINTNFRNYTKVNIRDVDLLKPYDSVKDLKILFIHGKKDDFIPYQNSIVMHKLKTDKEVDNVSKLVLFDNAKHSSSFHFNQEQYKNEIYDFLRLN
ncbi:hypothetical protein SCHIN_v1c04290 [Spiroplasma chinense]|uniref:Peptidase S9 prolyl oligopeptidase catalytic domain-containing protein n=1 Tax=Spiroplasma chinense TaxID=216932 RepID=A0A5B9Y4L2_9MOLU|nr:alpha/beta hydrolase [Spiroplasma chinense]QEH61626.1 hypothetical protein SCHIN_v1c04290 [Spiroplasma chinense]